VQSRRAVIEDDLEDRFAAAAPAFDTLCDDPAAGRGRLAQP